jgi:di/tricarboxylate transporter
MTNPEVKISPKKNWLRRSLGVWFSFIAYFLFYGAFSSFLIATAAFVGYFLEAYPLSSQLVSQVSLLIFIGFFISSFLALRHVLSGYAAFLSKENFPREEHVFIENAINSRIKRNPRRPF